MATLISKSRTKFKSYVVINDPEAKEKAWDFDIKKFKVTQLIKRQPTQTAIFSLYLCNDVTNKNLLNKKEGPLMALKKISGLSKEQCRRLLEELEVIRSFPHESIGEIFDAFYHYKIYSQDLYIVLPYYDKGDLFHYIKKRGKEPFHNKTILFVAHRVLDALIVIHARKHANSIRDLNTEKLVIKSFENGDTELPQVVICDLEDPRDCLVRGADCFWAPEVKATSLTCDAKSDVWSLGCVLVEMMTQGRAFAKGPPRTLITDEETEKKEHERLRKMILEINPVYNADVFLSMLKFKPEDRPTAQEVQRRLPRIYSKVYPSEDIYEGAWFEKKRNGIGKLIRANGDLYVGEWKNDKKHGKGTYTSCNGVKYEGDWKEDKREGRGILTFPDGYRYEGEWLDDKRNGKGIYTYPDGDIYEGDWADDKRHGNGVLMCVNGQKYDVQWFDDKITGKGSCVFASGAHYHGDWLDNNRHGYGVFVQPGLEKYEGEWKHDKMSGRGKYTSDNRDVYDGEWEENKKHGRGTFTSATGRVEDQIWNYGVLRKFTIVKK